MTDAHLWPRHTERLVLRPPTDDDLEVVLDRRHHPDGTRWLLTTQVDPDAYRAAWRADADDPRDHSVVALAGGEWHAGLGWVDGYTYAVLQDDPR